MEKESLKDKTVKGTVWSAIENVAQYVVTFVVGIVLARLLSPDDYGLIGIISIFSTVCTALIAGGFGSALIRKKNATNDDYNTAFLVNLGMSLLLYVIIFFSAPAIARFFERTELVILVRVSCISLLIGALAMVQETRLTKRLDFKSLTKITIVASVISGVVGIVMALLGCGVWSLVAQGLVIQTLKTVLLWVVNNWVPKLRFSGESFKELFGFGWKMMLSRLLDNIWKELYQVIVGKFYSPATLGQYTRAKQFSNLFSSNLTGVIQRVTYPVLSEVQDDNEKMVAVYRRIIKVTMFVSTVCMFFLGAVSEPLLYCLIGPKWHEAAEFLPLICIAGTLYPLHAINLDMLKVQGRSDLFLILEIIKKIIALGPLAIGAFVGIMPMLYANLVVGIISFLLNSYYSGRFLRYSSWDQIKDVTPSYLVATIVAFSVYFFKFLPVSNWIIFPLQVIVGSAVFFTLCRVFKVQEYEEAKLLLMPFKQIFKRK